MSPMAALEMIFVDKSPITLPKKVKQWVVSFLALFDVLFLVVTLFDVLRVLGLNTLSSPVHVGIAQGGQGLAVAVLIGMYALFVAALPGLFARRLVGWNMLFYGQLFYALYLVLSNLTFSAILSLLIMTFVLFQIKSYYKA
jgi:hypothetical protein